MDSVINRLEKLQYKYEDTLHDRDNKIDHLTNQLEIQQQTVREYQLIILELNKLIMKNDKKRKKLKKEKKYYKSLVQQQHTVTIDLTNDHDDIKPEKVLKEVKQEPTCHEPVSKSEVLPQPQSEPQSEPKIEREIEEGEIIEELVQQVVQQVQPVEEDEQETDIEEEEEQEQEVEEEPVQEEELEEEEVFEIKIKGKTYYTNNETIGSIYAEDENGDIGEEVGKFKNGIPVMFK